MTSQLVASASRSLKHAIVDSGRTQRAIALTARIEETRFSRIATGQITPEKRERKRLAKVLQRPVSELFPEVAS